MMRQAPQVLCVGVQASTEGALQGLAVLHLVSQRKVRTAPSSSPSRAHDGNSKNHPQARPVRKDATLCICATAVSTVSSYGHKRPQASSAALGKSTAIRGLSLQVNWETLKGGEISESFIEKQWLRLSAMCRLPTHALP